VGHGGVAIVVDPTGRRRGAGSVRDGDLRVVIEPLSAVLVAFESAVAPPLRVPSHGPSAAPESTPRNKEKT